MGLYSLIVGVLNYFSVFGAFVRFDFYPLGLLSYDAFVHLGSSVSAYVIT